MEAKKKTEILHLTRNRTSPGQVRMMNTTTTSLIKILESLKRNYYYSVLVSTRRLPSFSFTTGGQYTGSTLKL